VPKLVRPDTVLSPDTTLQASPATAAAPTTGFQATLSQPSPTVAPPPPAASLDFSSLDFDLSNPTTRQPDVPRTARPEPAPATRAPAPAPTVGGFGAIPDVDLSLPTRAPSPAAPTASFAAAAPAEPVRSTLLGDIGTITDDASTVSSPNTDMATVPLVDFVLTGADGGPSGRRTETQAGSPLAAQMETKLDLARGYIDLGVKDGARELLEEVMREGTREQRQSAVDLMKQVDG
jgi:pilus assembly protein FimV